MTQSLSNHNKSTGFNSESLNPQQKKAVLHKSGPLLVIAGAGSGKTRVITTRIAYLITEQKVSSHAIIALTFTNKAASEMKERVATFLPEGTPLPFIGTFHSYCLQLLKKYNHLLPTPFFSILDSDDQQKIISGILQRNNLNKQFTTRSVAYQISHIKNKSIEEPDDRSFDHPLVYEIYTAYESEKRASKCLDFDDLLLETVRLLKTNKQLKQTIQETVSHILVDEYQDTNLIQHELLKELAKNDDILIADSVCAVGDEDQSIYSWRGATIKNILSFKKDFPQTTTLKIEQNYRSVQPILDVANAVIEHNKNRNPKQLWSDKKASDRVRSVSCLSEYQESDLITTLVKTSKKKNQSIALLYRTHAQSRALEEAFIKQSISYKIIGGIQFYERKEIKDMLAYLRLIVNPFDRASLFRIINTPTRGLGSKFEEQLYARWHHEPFLSFIQVLNKMIEESIVVGIKKATIEQFLAIFECLTPTDSPSKALEQIIIKTQYVNHIKDSYDPDDAQARIENIKELQQALYYLESQEASCIEQFLDTIALMQEAAEKQKDDADSVLLMTLHAAKGLEFDTVVIVGMDEGILPTSRAIDDPAALEEERRLFYVGITRAREYLLLTNARYRYTYGTMVDQFPSRFLDELPDALVKKDNATSWKSFEMQRYIAQWLGIKTPEFGSIPPTYSQIPKIIETTPAETFPSSAWKKNQPVRHATYGIGMVEAIEKKDSNTTYITVRFKAGTKKIVSTFLQKM